MYAIRKLMLSAQLSLKRLKLDLDAFHMSDHAKDFVDYLSTPSRIGVAPLSVRPRISFIRNRTPHGTELNFILSIPPLSRSSPWLDLKRLDDILQRPYFVSITKLDCPFYVPFRFADVTAQPLASWYDEPDTTSIPAVSLQIQRLEVCLPQCSRRNIITPSITYAYMDDRPKLVQRSESLISPTVTTTTATTRVGKLKEKIRSIFRGVLFPFSR
ncbi:hypothetical protein L218DRAFT_115623 [Marasmius fiardii PR-910]|nr:hypothetical protein L218DRAFT_115623 [Marasmius fiardii PR-910]